MALYSIHLIITLTVCALPFIALVQTVWVAVAHPPFVDAALLVKALELPVAGTFD